MPTEPAPLTAAAFARLRLRYGAEPEPGELPAAIEHLFDAGRMVDHYLVTPAPDLPAAQAVRFAQQPGADAPWLVTLYPPEGDALVLPMPATAFRTLLDANGLRLPGEAGYTEPSGQL